jgi:DNA repair exonuclease SbcCD ATPase subunit
MKLLALTAEHFRCIRKSTVQFGPGLNVLHGPNDLGKSSLVAAIRAALLLQVSSRESQDFVNWHGSGDPHVELTFESEPQRVWKITKTFGDHPQAFLYESRDGVDFQVEARGRDVDGRLSEILRWGLAPPGGKGRPKGMPVTFLSSAFLAQQEHVAAIFSQALSADSDESGKKRLIEVLQAVAEDPVFKSVLHLVQAKVEEAFASSGQRRRGKDSPWMKIQEQIHRAEENERQWSDQLQKTVSIESELQELLIQRLDCESALGNLTEALRLAEDEYSHASERAAILKRVQESQKRLGEITSALQKLADTKARHADLIQMAGRLVEQETAAKAKLAATAAQVKIATESLRFRTADQDRERQLKQTTLQKNCAELRSRQAENETALSRIRTIQSLAERVRTLEAAAYALSAKISELTTRHHVAQIIRGNAAKAAIAEAETALAQIETWREQASQRRNTAFKVENSLNNINLPAVAGIDVLKRLEQQLQVARAKLGVGLHLAVSPKVELRMSVRRDGGEPQRNVLKEVVFSADANNEIQLDIEGIAEISLSGGEHSVREEVARLQARWSNEGEPVLTQTGLASIDEIAEAVKTRAVNLDEIRNLRQEAAVLEQRISDQPGWAAIRGERHRELDSSEEALLGTDRKKLEKLAAKTNLAQLHERVLESDLTTAKALRAEKQKDLAFAEQDLHAAGSAGDVYSVDLLAELLRNQSQLSTDLNQAELALKTLDTHVDAELSEAHGAVKLAEKEHAAADAKNLEIAKELQKTAGQRDSAEGELKILGESAAKLNEQAARLELGAIVAELALAPEPARVVTEELLATLRAGVKSKQAEVRDIENAIQSKNGALQHVGGQVAKERTEGAREELTLLREQERNLEIDYDAWALLRETLLEAEQQEGVHLGRVLGGPILQRFSDLTAGGYGKLALGPDLETDTITVAGEGRPLGALSVGTRDQLSIIFRLTLAEQLRSTVVLDDQLTQSDGERLVWLRSFIKEIAKNIQIVVFTCRPTDYLVPSELKTAKKTEHFNASFRSIDLTQLIERSGRQISPSGQG